MKPLILAALALLVLPGASCAPVALQTAEEYRLSARDARIGITTWCREIAEMRKDGIRELSDGYIDAIKERLEQGDFDEAENLLQKRVTLLATSEPDLGCIRKAFQLLDELLDQADAP